MAAAMCKCVCRSQNLRICGLRVSPFGTFISDKFCTNSSTEYYEDEEIEKLRDVSRLSPRLKKKANNQPYKPWSPDGMRVADFGHRKNRTFQRKMYAKFGQISGVDPKVLWPARNELRQMKEHEDMFEPSIQNKLAEAQSIREKIEDIDSRRIEKITECMEKMPQLIADFNAGYEKEEKEAQASKEKREQRLRETRDELGLHNVSLYDRRISFVLENKLKKEREELKARKKKEKKAKKLSTVT